MAGSVEPDRLERNLSELSERMSCEEFEIIVYICIYVPLRLPKVTILFWQVPQKIVWQVLENLKD
jgi:hypothetical protein